jgi:hypothetical protein
MSDSLFLKHAQLSLAAYGNFQPATAPDQAELRQVGFPPQDASDFASKWTVVDLYDPPLNGLSATVFKEVATGKHYLAIRGTDDLDDVVTDLISIAIIGTPALQLQYSLLKIKVEQWLASGVLPSTFSVTGHSLGGFLATGVGADFSSHIEHVYLYNAPGLNGILGNATSGVLRLLGVPSPIDPSKVSNLKADAGLSLIAGVGYQVSPPISIAIENQLLSDVPNSPAAKNHSQQVLTDSLAVYAAYQSIDG